MSSKRLDGIGFRRLLGQLASAWAAADSSAATACFTEDAIYMEPPDRQLFHGRLELGAYFSPLTHGTYLDIHGWWFDDSSQTGAVEFGFGERSRDEADHGVAVIELKDGLIDSWREYPRPGPASFERFIATEDKAWKWHAGNYP